MIRKKLSIGQGEDYARLFYLKKHDFKKHKAQNTKKLRNM